ncbi:Insulin-like [Cinara cedri]|uniref:Insulin-like n=1 Tax=Cinara cedri TaxID=506608 RepID=A0A5E4NGA9_9HEMI|nr:Insulin-like [Cinara cedri]
MTVCLADLKRFRWDDMQLYCGSIIDDIMQTICPIPSFDAEGKVIINARSHYHYWIKSQIDNDCCYTGGQGCTLRYILEKYCPFSERIDTTKDVIIAGNSINHLDTLTDERSVFLTQLMKFKKCVLPKKNSELLGYDTIQYLLCMTNVGCTIDLELLEALQNSLACSTLEN